MFRRRRETADLDEPDFDDADLDDSDLDESDSEAASSPPPAPKAPSGPWDIRDLPKDDETPRVDLGGILVPIPEGVELRVEVQEEVVVAAALVDGNSQLLIHAFAAPKSSGIWDDVRQEIAESLRGSGGSAEQADGLFGAELAARIPQEQGPTQPARFIGVDGPRWFLRGLISGAAATDPAQAGRLESVFRNVVVNRGPDAMAPRDGLALHLPRELIDAGEAGAGAGDPDGDLDDDLEEAPERAAPQFELRERGPEITEIQ